MSILKSPGRRKYKTWTSEDQIVAEIDRKVRLAKKKKELCEKLYMEKTILFRRASDILKEHDETESDLAEVRQVLWHEYKRLEGQAKMANRKSEMMGSQSARLTNIVLPRLKEILAAFRTETMPGILGSYKGVAVR